jgi:hypothetical protein
MTEIEVTGMEIQGSGYPRFPELGSGRLSEFEFSDAFPEGGHFLPLQAEVTHLNAP